MKEGRKRRMIERAQPLLPPGAEIRQIFGAQTKSAWLMAATGWVLFLLINKYRVVAVTRDAMYVMDAGTLSPTKPRRVIGVLPRATRLGPAGGLWTKVNVGPETLRVARYYRTELNAADAELDAIAPVGAAPGIAGPAVTGTQPAAGTVAMSPDGAAWWDGTRWVDCAAAAPPGAPRSADGSMWWDGARWRPLPATA